ncbi:MAG: hypothetical protein ACRD2N_24560 [Vicinamibacterales bacterium]
MATLNDVGVESEQLQWLAAQLPLEQKSGEFFTVEQLLSPG